MVKEVVSGRPDNLVSRTSRRTLFGVIVILHLAAAALALWPMAGGDTAFGASMVLAYALGVRHAFDADHIAVIDDTTRAMLTKRQDTSAVGFYFAMGHSSVVFIMAAIVAVLAGGLDGERVESFQQIGGEASAIIAIGFLTLVTAFNSKSLIGLVRVSAKHRRGELSDAELTQALSNRGVLNQLFGGRLTRMVRSPWQLFPVGFLMGLGLETASEVALLSLSGAVAAASAMPLWIPAVGLPLAFAAGMSACDTADSFMMTRMYSWHGSDRARMLRFNTITTGLTVVVAGVVVVIYTSAILATHLDIHLLAAIGGLSDHFELFGYLIAATFLTVWGGFLIRAYRTRTTAP